MSTKLPYGRRPFLLNEGERTKVQTDFTSCFSDKEAATIDELSEWVRNNNILWPRIQHVTNGRMDAMLGWGGVKVFQPNYSWGIDFNPLGVLGSHIADLARGALNKNFVQIGPKDTSLWYDVSRECIDAIYQEWKISKDPTLPLHPPTKI